MKPVGLWAAAVLLLSSCSAAAVPPTGTASPAATASPSSVVTATLPAPSAISTPAATSTASPSAVPTFAVLPGLTPLQNPNFPGLVFLVDTNRWADDSALGGTHFLHYKTNPACRLASDLGTGLAVPVHVDLAVMRGRVFHMYQFSGYSLYESRLVYFRLEGIGNLECRTVLETLLADVVDLAEFEGGPAATPYATLTPLALTGFTCQALPPQLHPGDTAYIVNSGVWLRSSPELGPNNKLKLFPKNSPVLVHIQDGPQCSGGYAYWQVTVTPLDPAGKPSSGWMAESNAQVYVLANWNP